MKTFNQPYDKVGESYRALIKGSYVTLTTDPTTGGQVPSDPVEFEKGIGPYPRKSTLKGQVTTYLRQFNGIKHFHHRTPYVRNIVKCEVEIQVSSTAWVLDESLDTSKWIV